MWVSEYCGMFQVLGILLIKIKCVVLLLLSEESYYYWPANPSLYFINSQDIGLFLYFFTVKDFKMCKINKCAESVPVDHLQQKLEEMLTVCWSVCACSMFLLNFSPSQSWQCLIFSADPLLLMVLVVFDILFATVRQRTGSVCQSGTSDWIWARSYS